MKRSLVLPLGLTAALALLSACQKPSQTAADTATATTNAAAGAAQDASNAGANGAANATDPGGAVSLPASNGAVNADANKSSGDVAAASNSFTEGQAKGHIENAGYTDVSNLTKSPDGLWTATAKKGGKTATVTLDFKGAVTAK